jgi:hypothetical protein
MSPYIYDANSIAISGASNSQNLEIFLLEIQWAPFNGIMDNVISRIIE